METELALRHRIRWLLIFFMCALIASGLTAIPLQWELSILDRVIEPHSVVQPIWPSLVEWIERVYAGLENSYGQYPFLAYGTDWLAFGHVAIAIAFIGALRDPIQNRWVVEFGILACLLVIPWALVFGSLRGIPPFWILIDMSFGVFGIIPLWFAKRDILKLEKGLYQNH